MCKCKCIKARLWEIVCSREKERERERGGECEVCVCSWSNEIVKVSV